MRNLKRVLALAMALVMILGMMVIGSSAASYSDAAAIDEDYAVAVEVLSGMGVFKGTGAGFAPKQILTRAEASALVYRVITGDVADKQIDLYDYTSFADVKEGAWYTGYITYAANGGYIKGYNGNAMPNDTVTGIQVLAMMLRAAGYGQNGEFEGAGWKDGILTVAKEEGIIAGISTNDLDKPASRELVAQLLFNAITGVKMVAYSPLLTGYIPLTFDVATDGKLGVKATQTLAQKVFKLASAATEDAWGRPATVWFKNTDGDKDTDGNPVWDYLAKGKKAEPAYAILAEEALAVYTEAVSDCDIAKVMGLKANAVGAKAIEAWYNGDETTTDIYLTSAAKNNGGQGTLLEVYEDRIVVIDTYLAKVMTVIDAEFDKNGHLDIPATLVLKVCTKGDHEETIVLESDENWEYSKFDMLLINAYTVDNAGNDIAVGDSIYGTGATNVADYVEFVDYAPSFEGAQSAHTNKASHVIDGVEYPDAKQFNHNEAVDKTIKYTWYQDQYGNLIGSVKIDTVYNYGVISAIKWVDQNNTLADSYALAKITYMDGTEEEAVVYSVNGYAIEDAVAIADIVYGEAEVVGEETVYNYTVYSNKDANDEIWARAALYKIASGRFGLELTEMKELTTDASVETGVTAIDEGVYAGATTKFLVWNSITKEYTTYTGITSIPTYLKSDVEGTYWAANLEKDGDIFAEYVFINDAEAATAKKEVTFYAARPVTVTFNKYLNRIISYTVSGGLVNGEPQDIVVPAAYWEAVKDEVQTVKVLMTLDLDNGYVVDAEAVTTIADEIGMYTDVFAVYALEASAAELNRDTSALVANGYGYYLTDETQVITYKYDLETSIERDDAAYLYIVYTLGKKDTKTAQYIYITNVEGTEATPVAPVTPVEWAAVADALLKVTDSTKWTDAMFAQAAAASAELSAGDAADKLLSATLDAHIEQMKGEVIAADELKAAKDAVLALIDANVNKTEGADKDWSTWTPGMIAAAKAAVNATAANGTTPTRNTAVYAASAVQSAQTAAIEGLTEYEGTYSRAITEALEAAYDAAVEAIEAADTAAKVTAAKVAGNKAMADVLLNAAAAVVEAAEIANTAEAIAEFETEADAAEVYTTLPEDVTVKAVVTETFSDEADVKVTLTVGEYTKIVNVVWTITAGEG